MFHFKNGGYLPIAFSSFLMKLFLLPTERTNKIIKSKYFDQCVGSVSAKAFVRSKSDEEGSRVRDTSDLDRLRIRLLWANLVNF